MIDKQSWLVDDLKGDDTLLYWGSWTHSAWESCSELIREIGGQRWTEDFEHCSSAHGHLICETSKVETIDSRQVGITWSNQGHPKDAEVQLAGAFPTSTTTRIWMHVALLQLLLYCLKVKVLFLARQ